jgi:DNA-binding MarR family transcriptional regulator
MQIISQTMNTLHKDPDGTPAFGTSAPRGCTNLKLKQASRLVARHYEAYVAPTGLRHTQYSLLSHVVKLGPLRAGELATAMRLDASTLSRNLQPLIDRGLVDVTTGADQRSRVVQASAAGVALRQQAQKAWKRAQLALNERLGAPRVAQLHALLDQCMALLSEEVTVDA